MADTIKSLTDLQSDLADNGAAGISAADLRHFLVTAIPGGRVAAQVVSSSAITDLEKFNSDEQADGTNDSTEIQAALDALPT